MGYNHPIPWDFENIANRHVGFLGCTMMSYVDPEGKASRLRVLSLGLAFLHAGPGVSEVGLGTS